MSASPDGIVDLGGTNEVEETVKDVVTRKDLEDVKEPTEEVLLEREDLKTSSPCRASSSDTLHGKEEGGIQTALVAQPQKSELEVRQMDVEKPGSLTESERSESPPTLPVTREATPSDNSTNNVRWWLYLSQIFGRWGDRMWSFTSALFLLELFPGSMLLPAIHGFITGLSVILLGALIGEWVDRTPRLRAVRVALIVQNSSVAVGSLILTFAFLFRDSLDDVGKLGCVFGFMLFAVVGDCASVAMNIIVEKDWVVVIAGGIKTDLADMNATIRRIDLTCQILSPIIIAQVITFFAHYVGTIVVSVWNVLSMLVEYFILHKIYLTQPQLATKTIKSMSENGPPEKKRKPLVRKIFRSCFSIREGWQAFRRNRTAPAGLCLAFLYMTVLSFDGVTNTYVRTQGLSESVISIMMAFGAVTGIGGTFVFPQLRKKIGLERTGLFALASQLFCLSFCVLSVWLPGSPFNPSFVAQRQNESWSQLKQVNQNMTDIGLGKWITRPIAELPSVIVFMGGMIGARFGLWMADLTITQLIQENVAEKERGVIGGVQNSLNRFMDMLKFILVICLPYPETFGILIIISFLFVLCGYCPYAYYTYQTRGHLLPHCKPAPVSNGAAFDQPSIVLNQRNLVSSVV